MGGKQLDDEDLIGPALPRQRTIRPLGYGRAVGGVKI